MNLQEILKEYKRARIRGDKYLIDKARNKIDKINELLVFAKKNKKIIFLYPKKLRRKCIFREICASVPKERSAIPLETEQRSVGN